jgi:hypothetical protein
MKRLFLLFFIAVCFIPGFSQDVIPVSATDIPGIIVTKTDTFTGQGLYGYIDGGADLYFEYGFRKLFVNEFVSGPDRVKLEIFVMDDAPSAFGIYSQAIANCRQYNKFARFSCITPYQVAAATGPLFINALNSKGTATGQEVCENLVRITVEKNPQESWYAPAFAQSPKIAPFINSLQYFEGPLSMINTIPAWADLFKDLEFNMYTVRILSPGQTGMLARIEFPDVSTMERFLMRSGVNTLDQNATPERSGNGLYRSWFKINSTRMLFLESTSEYPFIRDMLPAMRSTIPDQRW